ncbi:MAG: NAD-dependent epimerase/dehydratase family protein [Byssovorax sp.]
MSDRVVLVTGASGFVGSSLLASYPGARTRIGLLRPGRSGDARDGLSFRTIESWTEEALTRAFTGVDAVVHAASVVHHPGATEAEYARFNVEGTRALIQACKAAGVKRLVFISTIKVYGEEPRAGVIDESTPVVGDSPYGRTKIEAEQLVLAAAGQGGLSTAVLRLCPVFGRGDKSNVQTMIRAIARRRFVLPGGGRNRKSIVHISTVTEVARAAVDSDAPGVFLVADSEAPTMRELADTMARVLRAPRPPSVPEPLVRGALTALEAVFSLSGKKAPFTREQLRKLLEPTVCSPRRAQADLGASCHVDLEQAIADETRWLREAALLPAQRVD